LFVGSTTGGVLLGRKFEMTGTVARHVADVAADKALWANAVIIVATADIAWIGLVARKVTHGAAGGKGPTEDASSHETSPQKL
jgi:hypothetical protein